MQKFEDYLKNNPELLEKTKKSYWEKTPERTEQFNIAIEKVEQGYPRKAVISWLQDICGWKVAYKTISDYIGEYVKETE